MPFDVLNLSMGQCSGRGPHNSLQSSINLFYTPKKQFVRKWREKTQGKYKGFHYTKDRKGSKVLALKVKK